MLAKQVLKVLFFFPYFFSSETYIFAINEYLSGYNNRKCVGNVRSLSFRLSCIFIVEAREKQSVYVFRSIDCDKRNVRKMVIKDCEKSRDNNTFIY